VNRWLLLFKEGKKLGNGLKVSQDLQLPMGLDDLLGLLPNGLGSVGTSLADAHQLEVEQKVSPIV
jgi:hypothetical protein